ncbi:MAG TPA: 3-dehydroquinate synthase [Microbacteriaceae bacterium]|nr:3-dehydroquinate synthase [Microbacteriaceae bacterium]
MTLTEIRVAGPAPYSVWIGPSATTQLASVLGDRVSKILIIHSGRLGAKANALRESLLDRWEVLLAEVPDAEAAKRIEVAGFCWQVLGQAEFSRTDAIIGLGGGAVTDLAGFVAATWLRGVPFVSMPTSVNGMVDAAIGGKTGVNTAEGKNLVGTFTSPAAVLCDFDTLDTLPENEIRAGFAEIVKAGLIAYPEILDIVERDVDQALDPSSPEFRRVMELAITMKAEIVGEDFTEQGRREHLNFGHTLGHAIEHAERYQWRHGAAISVGLVFAAELSALARGLDEAIVHRTRRVLNALGLPTTYPADRWNALLAVMQRDKKVRGGQLRFVVLDDLARPMVWTAPDSSLPFAAFQEVAP